MGMGDRECKICGHETYGGPCANYRLKKALNLLDKSVKIIVFMTESYIGPDRRKEAFKYVDELKAMIAEV